MARLVVPANLPGREHPRAVDSQRDEPQITLESGEGVGALCHGIRSDRRERHRKLAARAAWGARRQRVRLVPSESAQNRVPLSPSERCPPWFSRWADILT